MAKKDKIYITSMHRWGDSDSHTYIIFAGLSKHKAIQNGEEEADARGGKYEYEIIEFTPDEIGTKKVIKDRAKNRRLL